MFDSIFDDFEDILLLMSFILTTVSPLANIVRRVKA